MEKRTYADRRAYNVQATIKRRDRVRHMAGEYLGGKCCFCAYDRCFAALDFHHVDESKKNFTIRDGVTRSWFRVQQELENCILVCANCHREIHAGLLQPVLVIIHGKIG
jgi:hypothetical protein